MCASVIAPTGTVHPDKKPSTVCLWNNAFITNIFGEVISPVGGYLSGCSLCIYLFFSKTIVTFLFSVI